MSGRRSPLLLVAASIAACADGEPRDVAAAPEWRVELESRIGSIDDPEQALTQVNQVVIGPAGELFVRQSRDRVVRRYAPDGALTARIGRGGEGPGEFGNLTTIGLVGDTLWAADSRLLRVSFFSLDGELLGTRAWASEQRRRGEFIYEPTTPHALVDGATALVKPAGIGRPVRPTEAIATMRLPMPVLRIDTTSTADTIAWETHEIAYLQMPRGGVDYSVQVPFGDGQLVELMPDGSGVAIVDRRTSHDNRAATFTVTFVNPLGDTIFSHEVPYSPIPLEPAAARRAVEEARVVGPAGESKPTPAEIMAALRDEGVIRTTHVPVTDIVGAQDGSIWLRREDARPDSVDWTILAPDGAVAGTLRLPRAQTVLAAKGDLLITRELSELEVPYLVRYAIRR